ncbi:PHB depolymerase family esterase [Paracoccus sp. 11-3]|uniref:PHB depolymerase family esterase n=1 Tax=Paracoccus amoyensis TaxID=2760093 RepID=A0A926GBG0_9RHOB|nr:PHB depolymerase family esterase [Paracoccus amoyensis]MBC9246906.1 PHB depolymerase family esterase [Paracoccus amoyensis]
MPDCLFGRAIPEISTMARRRKISAGARRIRKANSILTGGMKLAASFASTALQAMASANPTTPKKQPVKKKAYAATASKAKKATVTSRVKPASSFRAGVHDCEHGSRAYKLFKPGMAMALPKPPPLLVMLHGCGQTPDDFAKGTRMNILAKKNGMIVVYPAQSRDAHPNRCWNWFHRDNQSRDSGEPAILASLTRKILQLHGADPARVYISGLSAGASMALIMAREYPDLFAAVGVHSGLPSGSAQDQGSALMAMQRGNPGRRLHHTMPTIVFHGSHDRVVNPRNGRLVAIRAREAYQSLRGTESAGRVPNGRYYRKAVHRIGAGRPLVEHWNVSALGHAWSGGSPTGRFTDQKGPDASQEMIRFFLRHSLSSRRRAALARVNAAVLAADQI